MEGKKPGKGWDNLVMITRQEEASGNGCSWSPFLGQMLGQAAVLVSDTSFL